MVNQVLVVAYDRSLCDILSDMVKPFVDNSEVRKAFNAAEALDMVKQGYAPWLMISDYNLRHEGGGGIELTEGINELYRQAKREPIHVIYISGDGRVAGRVSELHDPNATFLYKPFTISVLGEEVNKHKPVRQ